MRKSLALPVVAVLMVAGCASKPPVVAKGPPPRPFFVAPLPAGAVEMQSTTPRVKLIFPSDFADHPAQAEVIIECDIGVDGRASNCAVDSAVAEDLQGNEVDGQLYAAIELRWAEQSVFVPRRVNGVAVVSRQFSRLQIALH